MATKDLKVGVVAVPVAGPAKIVLAFCEARSAVSVPEVVTEEVVKVKMLGKLKLTFVTVPLPVPAPIAVLKAELFSVETELSAFILMKVMALGFVRVNKFAPTVVAPNATLAAA